MGNADRRHCPKREKGIDQRKLLIGYNSAARIIKQIEENGVASAANHVGKREVLMENMDGSPYEY
ncbi:DNA translocase FtsK [Thalassospira sp.]|uniref:DNA translocase FtsK n=1 Tax=Thalassospira sp. TaxID=1912094 RepID=UPI003AA874E7